MQFFYLSNETILQQTESATSFYKNRVLLLIVFISLLKCFLSFWLEFGNDEAYYWFYSQYWQWNYFDHPPMVAVWIRLFTFNLALEQYEGFVRLGSVVGSALATWFMYRSVSDIYSQRAGWYAAVLYNASFYSGITAGLYIMPDSPQMVFWTLGFWCLAKITKEDNNWKYWLLFGCVAGLCIMSKVHGAFLWIGLGGYILFQKNKWLVKPQLYISFLLTVLIISPIFFWNVKYDFATFRFHGNRIDVDEFVFRGRFLLKEIGSQAGFNNPVNFGLVAIALWAVFRKKLHLPAAMIIYCFVGLPLAFMLLAVSVFRNVTLPHWSGPAYISLLPVAAAWLSGDTQSAFPKILKWSIGIFLFIYLGYCCVVKFYPGSFGSREGAEYGRGDITLDMYGWRQAAAQFQNLYQQEVSTGLMPANASLVTSNWWGAHVEYYFARPLKLKMIGLGKLDHLNEYLWTNQWRVNQTDLNHAYCIIPADDKYYAPADFYKFKDLAAIIRVNRNGKMAHEFLVYRLKDLKKPVPLIK